MTKQTKLNAVISVAAIPDRYREIIHTHNLTCTFSCAVGKRAGGSLHITSSNVNPEVFHPAERDAILRGDRDVIIVRGAATFLYRLIHKTASTRVYRIASHSVDFTQGKF